MRPSTEVHDALARLLEYPSPALPRLAGDAAALLARELPEAAHELTAFVAFSASHELGDCEELYVRTFDANAERALEIGWQVFGEQYERGAFLVRMRQLLRQCGVAESVELPDHLAHVLRVLPRVDERTASCAIGPALEPSLRRILAGFEDAANPYAGVLRAVRLVTAASAGAPTDSLGAADGGVR